MLDPLSISIPLGPEPTVHSFLPRPQRKLLTPSPDHPDDYVIELDYSSLSNFMQCPRKSENYSVFSRELAGPSSATDFGKLFHSCEELRLRNGWSEETKQAQFRLVEQHFLSHPTAPSDHRTSERMLAVLQQYNKTYNESLPDLWPSKVRHVEVPFKVPLCSIEVDAILPYRKSQIVASSTNLSDPMDVDDFLKVSSLHILYTGRIDTVLTDSNLLWVADHKTSSRGGKEFVEAFRLSRQTLGYVWAAQKLLGEPIAGCILNALVIKPPTLKLFNNTDLERHTFFYSQEHLQEWEVGMRWTVTDFVSCLVRGYWPQQAQSFKSPCALCDYAENCALPPAQRAADLTSNLYQNVTWSPID